MGEIAVCVNGPTRSPPLRQCVIWISCSIRCIHMPESCLHKQRQRGWNDAWMALPETDNKKRGPKGKVFYVKKHMQIKASCRTRSVSTYGEICTFVLGGGLGSLGSLIRCGGTLYVCVGWRSRIARFPHSVRGDFVRLFWLAFSDRSDPSFGTGHGFVGARPL